MPQVDLKAFPGSSFILKLNYNKAATVQTKSVFFFPGGGTTIQLNNIFTLKESLALLKEDLRKQMRIRLLALTGKSWVWWSLKIVKQLTSSNLVWWQGKEKVKPRGSFLSFIPIFSRKLARQSAMWSNNYEREKVVKVIRDEWNNQQTGPLLSKHCLILCIRLEDLLELLHSQRWMV